MTGLSPDRVLVDDPRAIAELALIEATRSIHDDAVFFINLDRMRGTASIFDDYPDTAILSDRIAQDLPDLIERVRFRQNWPIDRRPGFVTPEPLSKRARRRARGKSRA